MLYTDFKTVATERVPPALPGKAICLYIVVPYMREVVRFRRGKLARLLII
jgi:hypothetical protein